MIFKAIMMEFCDKPKECLRWGQYPCGFFFHFIFSEIRSVRIKYWMSLCTNICNRFFSSCIIIWKLWVRKFVMWHPCDKNYWNLWKRVYKNTNLKGCERWDEINKKLPVFFSLGTDAPLPSKKSGRETSVNRLNYFLLFFLWQLKRCWQTNATLDSCTVDVQHVRSYHWVS